MGSFFGYLDEIRPVLVNLHTAVIGKRKSIPLKNLMNSEDRRKTTADAQTGLRDVWFSGRKLECPIYRREALPLGTKLKGAAILEQLDTTVIVNPDDLVEVDDFGNVIMSVGED